MLIHSVFKISSLCELKPRTMYAKLLLREGRVQVGITLCDVWGGGLQGVLIYVLCLPFHNVQLR